MTAREVEGTSMKETTRSKSVTVRELAKICNVSPATVSRVLSGSSYPVSDSVREDVLRTAAQYGYTARSKTVVERDDEVAILVPTTANPFYATMIQGFEQSVVREGFQVLVYHSATGFPQSDDDRVLRSLLTKGLKGVVISASNNSRMLETGAKRLLDAGIKVVLADCPQSENRFHCISYSYEKGAYLAARYLIDHGHRHIAYAGLPVDRESRQQRISGYRRAMDAEQLPVSVVLHEPADEHAQIVCGENLADRILSLTPRPTAVLAINDLVALGLLRELQQRGIRVPEDISVVGYDDSPYSEASNPPLTTVRVQAEQMGQMAAMLLLNDIHGVTGEPVILSLEPVLVERGSVSDLRR